MRFYEHIAVSYDNIFPLNQKTLNFLKTAFKNQTYLLDVGCATGSYANALSSDFNVEAIDFDSQMINYALKKHSNVQFKVMDMKNIEGHYDGIYCIGNTLAHLNDETEIKNMVEKFYHCLNENGTLVIQIVNYERILKNHIETLPLIKNDKVEFIRHYQFNLPYLNFSTTLNTQNQTFKQTTKLYPIQYETLMKMLKEAHFNDIVCYGSFDYARFDLESSFSLVIKARKS